MFQFVFESKPLPNFSANGSSRDCLIRYPPWLVDTPHANLPSRVLPRPKSCRKMWFRNGSQFVYHSKCDNVILIWFGWNHIGQEHQRFCSQVVRIWMCRHNKQHCEKKLKKEACFHKQIHVACHKCDRCIPFAFLLKQRLFHDIKWNPHELLMFGTDA